MVSTYGTRIPNLPKRELPGHLIVVEGADGSGRTTEVELLREWLEIQGHPVVDTGLRRSTLVSKPIDRAKRGHTLGATTMALFYAADFADQLENKILPALAAGSTVLADRYTYTLMARAIVRGASREYAQQLYSFAFEPDLIVFLDARPDILLHRAIAKYGSLDYWESGMDLSLSRDRFESFSAYQALLKKEFDWMARTYGFQRVDANRTPFQVHRDVKALVAALFGKRVRVEIAGEIPPHPTPEAEVSGLGAVTTGNS
ncbi:MAG: thymidylate kinase [Thermoplasmata archaeon]|nr:thymidylate kinase [Thermoplasmata archaeon]